MSCLHDVRTFFPFSKSSLDYVNHEIIAASVFRQLFCGHAVFVNFLCHVSVFRATPPPPPPLTSFSSLVRSIKGREGTGRRERAAKGDGKGKTRDVYKTWTGVHGPGPWTTLNFQKEIAPVNMKIYRRSGYEKHRLVFFAYVLEGLSHKNGLLWDRAPINGRTANSF